MSAPYARSGENLEVDLHLKSGYRTTGMVEITLDDGTTGLGEGYLAVFAPKVFVSIVELIAPQMIGRDVMNIRAILQDLSTITDYWSLQGAARHVHSAFEIAFQDCRAKVLGVPIYRMLHESSNNSIQLYGSGGDSPSPEFMRQEFRLLKELGIKKFKIRARGHQVEKAVWCMALGQKRGIDIAVDMAQNLTNPGQTLEEVVGFHENISAKSKSQLLFLEEVLGIWTAVNYPDLRARLPVKIAGGEIVTTPQELIDRIVSDWYDIVQPDATVIGGISAVLRVFEAANLQSTEVMVHSWGGPVAMMANYHAALAGGGILAEWPMPSYPIRDALVEQPWRIEDGILHLPDIPGLGVRLTPKFERQFPFRKDAVYNCLTETDASPQNDVWKL